MPGIIDSVVEGATAIGRSITRAAVWARHLGSPPVEKSDSDAPSVDTDKAELERKDEESEREQDEEKEKKQQAARRSARSLSMDRGATLQPLPPAYQPIIEKFCETCGVSKPSPDEPTAAVLGRLASKIGGIHSAKGRTLVEPGESEAQTSQRVYLAVLATMQTLATGRGLEAQGQDPIQLLHLMLHSVSLGVPLSEASLSNIETHCVGKLTGDLQKQAKGLLEAVKLNNAFIAKDPKDEIPASARLEHIQTELAKTGSPESAAAAALIKARCVEGNGLFDPIPTTLPAAGLSSAAASPAPAEPEPLMAAVEPVSPDPVSVIAREVKSERRAVGSAPPSDAPVSPTADGKPAESKTDADRDRLDAKQVRRSAKEEAEAVPPLNPAPVWMRTPPSSLQPAITLVKAANQGGGPAIPTLGSNGEG